METTLKNCPFCGGTAHLAKNSRTYIKGKPERITYVYCTECDSRGRRFAMKDFSPHAKAMEAAVEAWNKRTEEENHE